MKRSLSLMRHFCSQQPKHNPISMEEASKQITHYSEMPNSTILQLSLLGDQDAREERLIREIMTVEKCSWIEAQPIFETMLAENRKYQSLINLPYNIGIFGAVAMGIGSFPMVFDLNTC